jgi:hypothetical protein
MSANPVWAESPRDRHVRLVNELEAGILCDPESWLFLRLLSDCVPVLSETPLLAGASWGGRFDLLFTDGVRRWCAVELKVAPEIYSTGSSRRHRRDKARERANRLYWQTSLAHAACQAAHPGDEVTALGMWFQNGKWCVLHSIP